MYAWITLTALTLWPALSPAAPKLGISDKDEIFFSSILTLSQEFPRPGPRYAPTLCVIASDREQALEKQSADQKPWACEEGTFHWQDGTSEERIREPVRSSSLADWQTAFWNGKKPPKAMPLQFTFDTLVSGQEIRLAYEKLLGRCATWGRCRTYFFQITGDQSGHILPIPINAHANAGPRASSFQADQNVFRVENTTLRLLLR